MGHLAVPCPSWSDDTEAVSESIRPTRDIDRTGAMGRPSAFNWTRSVWQDRDLPILPMTQEVMGQFAHNAASPATRRSATWAGSRPRVDATAA